MPAKKAPTLAQSSSAISCSDKNNQNTSHSERRVTTYVAGAPTDFASGIHSQR